MVELEHKLEPNNIQNSNFYGTVRKGEEYLSSYLLNLKS